MTPRATRLREEHGVVAANLAITIGFALFAVIELTRTLLAANSIDDRVKVITSEVVPINTDLDQVARLDETARMAGEIMTAAQNLSGVAGQIVDITASIDNTGSQILGAATSINGTVKGITGNATDILGNVLDINQASQGINSDLSAILPETVTIDTGVAEINRRVDVVISRTIPIDEDLTNVDNLVNSIAVSAESICNSPAIQGGC